MRTTYPPIEPYASGWLEVDHGHRVYWERSGTPGATPPGTTRFRRALIHVLPPFGACPSSKDPTGVRSSQNCEADE